MLKNIAGHLTSPERDISKLFHTACTAILQDVIPFQEARMLPSDLFALNEIPSNGKGWSNGAHRL